MNCPSCNAPLTPIEGKYAKLFKRLRLGKSLMVQRYECHNSTCLLISVETIVEM